MTDRFFAPRHDFADTLVLHGPRLPWALPGALKKVTAPVDIDPLEQMALTDRADWALLRLVGCAALATLVLALASSLRA
jgi:hypothetical protein